jgi:hypothetical protein
MLPLLQLLMVGCVCPCAAVHGSGWIKALYGTCRMMRTSTGLASACARGWPHGSQWCYIKNCVVSDAIYYGNKRLNQTLYSPWACFKSCSALCWNMPQLQAVLRMQTPCTRTCLYTCGSYIAMLCQKQSMFRQYDLLYSSVKPPQFAV